ncbi:hypothetical protein Psuf_063370 [Phytohabitans suffuscus]|uniref:Uncharacterized protein n=1 Tax=Phytohabitans suffuscus TaxID=624315 RepID=A0A6F8YSD8_9ACTN|nr:hypothetical protein [Phytohabitans suffuscus]BCB89024.1 hypothetical protein Psuf_063370 [Phytohabitans suffuscus]
MGVAVDPSACTYSATALVTVSAATTVTYRVTWSDGSSGTASADFAAPGGGTLAVPTSVPHGAGPVWVQVDVLTPTPVTQRGGGELPASCSPSTPSAEPDPSPMASPSSPNPGPPADQSPAGGPDPTSGQPTQATSTTP